ncbi:band 4.1-like protein 4A [Caerostris extrusa]|uniref:Band 4.1-like protein 4A n=1 Tax=Caerostris extrusa TaxID=172846 RepID=A0AAV4PKK9_CAEEX|nr:band 4.1-like protein 4A [Caerostris extrusa]
MPYLPNTLHCEADSKGDVLLERVFSHLNLIEKAYFGLRFLNRAGESRWLDPLQKVSTQLKGLSPFTLYFGVKFYASDPCRLLEEITRYQFVLQLKQDILQGRLPLADDLASELFALSLQAELGTSTRASTRSSTCPSSGSCRTRAPASRRRWSRSTRHLCESLSYWFYFPYLVFT